MLVSYIGVEEPVANKRLMAIGMYLTLTFVICEFNL